MKINIILGKSINDFIFKSMGNSFQTSIHYFASDSAYVPVWNSVGRPLLIKTQLNIIIWKQI